MDILTPILFFLPAGVANAAPVIANKIPLINRWRTPVDFGVSWRGKRLTGDNKTWRGIVVGVVIAGLVAYAISEFFTVPLFSERALAVGMLLGFGALLGDAVESVLKRQIGIQPGESWRPWDQLDYIVGGVLVTLPFVSMKLADLFIIFCVYFVLHLIVAYIGYKLGLKSTPI